MYLLVDMCMHKVLALMFKFQIMFALFFFDYSIFSVNTVRLYRSKLALLVKIKALKVPYDIDVIFNYFYYGIFWKFPHTEMLNQVKQLVIDGRHSKCNI